LANSAGSSGSRWTNKLALSSGSGVGTTGVEGGRNMQAAWASRAQLAPRPREPRSAGLGWSPRKREGQGSRLVSGSKD
jgi:hypothetical protein